MFSKPIKAGFCLFLLATLSLSCSEYLRGSKKSDDVLQVEAKETQCLKGTADFLNRYFEDQSSQADISANLSCLRQSLKTFTRFTTGASPDQYTQVELQHFFNRYLLDANKIQDSFMDEIMKMKVLAVGGASRSFSRLELDQFSQFLVQVEAQMIKLNGYWRLILFKSEDQVSQNKITLEKIDRVASLMKDSIKTLIFESKISNSDYEFSDLQSFFTQINRFLAADDGRLKALLQWLPLMKSVKTTFLGEYLKISSRSEWKEQIEWAVDSYSVAMKYFFVLKGLRLDKPEGWELLLPVVDQALDLMQSAPSLRAQGVLLARNIDQLLDEAIGLDLIPFQISPDIIKGTYKKILFHWFDEKKGNALDEIRGVEERHLGIFANGI